MSDREQKFSVERGIGWNHVDRDGGTVVPRPPGRASDRKARLLLAPQRRLRLQGWPRRVLRRRDEPDLHVLTLKHIVGVVGVGLLAVGCGAEGVTEAHSASGASSYTAKCKSSSADCVAMARERCPDGYDLLQSESHAGGVLADAIPGPVTWYTMTFRCGAPAAHVELGPQIESARQEALSRAVWPVCAEPPKPGKCGLVADHYMSDEHIEQYIAHACHEDPKETPSETCGKAFRADFFDDVRGRYTLAVQREVDAACASEADRCTTLVGVELQFLRSHNGAVARAFDARVDEIAAAYEAERRKTASQAPAFARSDSEGAALAIRAIGAGLRGFSEGWQQSASAQPKSPAAQTARSQTQSCSSDIQCGGPGYMCSKPAGSIEGECAQAVNKYGLQEFSRGADTSFGPGKRQCDFSTPCPIGFTCSEGRCLKQ